MVLSVVGNDGLNSALKDLVDTEHLFTAAFHVLGVHFVGNGKSLFSGDWCETLGLEHLDTRFLVAQI